MRLPSSIRIKKDYFMEPAGIRLVPYFRNNAFFRNLHFNILNLPHNFFFQLNMREFAVFKLQCP